MRNTSNYSAMGPVYPRANNSIFSFSGSEQNRASGPKTGDFPYQASGSMAPAQDKALRSIDNDYSHISQALDSIKPRESTKAITSTRKG